MSRRDRVLSWYLRAYAAVLLAALPATLLPTSFLAAAPVPRPGPGGAAGGWEHGGPACAAGRYPRAAAAVTPARLVFQNFLKRSRLATIASVPRLARGRKHAARHPHRGRQLPQH